MQQTYQVEFHIKSLQITVNFECILFVYLKSSDHKEETPPVEFSRINGAAVFNSAIAFAARLSRDQPYHVNFFVLIKRKNMPEEKKILGKFKVNLTDFLGVPVQPVLINKRLEEGPDPNASLTIELKCLSLDPQTQKLDSLTSRNKEPLAAPKMRSISPSNAKFKFNRENSIDVSKDLSLNTSNAQTGTPTNLRTFKPGATKIDFSGVKGYLNPASTGRIDVHSAEEIRQNFPSLQHNETRDAPAEKPSSKFNIFAENHSFAVQ